MADEMYRLLLIIGRGGYVEKLCALVILGLSMKE